MKVSRPLLNTSSSKVLAVRTRTGPSLSAGGSSLFTHFSSLPAWVGRSVNQAAEQIQQHSTTSWGVDNAPQLLRQGLPSRYRMPGNMCGIAHKLCCPALPQQKVQLRPRSPQTASGSQLHPKGRRRSSGTWPGSAHSSGCGDSCVVIAAACHRCIACTTVESSTLRLASICHAHFPSKPCKPATAQQAIPAEAYSQHGHPPWGPQSAARSCSCTAASGHSCPAGAAEQAWEGWRW